MAGDREAFTELTRRSIGRLYAIARLILRDTERAEDATQEALVAAWKQLSALRADGRVPMTGDGDGSGAPSAEVYELR